jgi:serine/threonine protein kinase
LDQGRHKLKNEERLNASAADESNFDAQGIAEGTLFRGRYRVEKFLGQGGMSQVFKCEDLLLQRTVAIKILLPSVIKESRNTARLHREAAAVSKLKHPNIVGLHEFVPMTKHHIW